MSALYAGFFAQPGKWSSNVKLGGVNTPPVEFVIDESLPSLGQDPAYPNRDWVVIPHGRIVAAKATDLTRLAGETIITLANGVDPLDAPSFAVGNVAFGYAPYNIFKSWSGLPAERPLGVKDETIEVPYTIVNEAYNNVIDSQARLKVGEWVMAYYGSKNKKTQISAKDKGKMVRFVEKQVWLETAGTATGSVKLTKAPYPAFKPRVLAAWTAAGVVDLSGATVAYDENVSAWVATFGQSVKHVQYSYGASDSQRIGQIIGIEPIGKATATANNATSHEMGGWLKWVTEDRGRWDWPLMLDNRAYSTATDEAVTIDANNLGTLAHSPVVPFRPITVTLSGVITNDDGTQTTYSDTVMAPLDEMYFSDYTQGLHYDIDMLDGTIRLSQSVTTVYSVKVTYSYESTFRDGLTWGTGILGLTDGSGGTGIPGTQAHLDVAGGQGALRVIIR